MDTLFSTAFCRIETRLARERPEYPRLCERTAPLMFEEGPSAPGASAGKQQAGTLELLVESRGPGALLVGYLPARRSALSYCALPTSLIQNHHTTASTQILEW
jgi:hypothetical protein